MDLVNKQGQKLRFNTIGKIGNKYVVYYFSPDGNPQGQQHQLSFNLKFLGIEPSTLKNKKYTVLFQIGTKHNTELKEPVIKKIHFTKWN